MTMQNEMPLRISRFSLLLSAVLIGGCDDTPPTGGRAEKVATVDHAPSKRQPFDCNLITAAEIQRITGVPPGESQPIPQSQFAGCQWLFQDNPKVLVQIMLSPRSIGHYRTFDEYISGMTEDYGKDTVEGQKEIEGLGALAVLHTTDNMLAVAAGEMDLYVNAARNVVTEDQLVALTELVLERMR
jgi:hypothetical protein